MLSLHQRFATAPGAVSLGISACRFRFAWLASCAAAAVLLISTLVASPPARASTVVSSTFDTDDDGWFVQSINGLTGEFLDTFTMVHSTAGGNPDGFIEKIDPEVHTWFFSAPPKFLGDISWAYDGHLNFDRIELSPIGELFSLTVVGLVSAGMPIVYETEFPGTVWTHESVPMNETGWVHFPQDTPVTQEEFMAVLSSLDALVIQGDTRFLHDDGAALDNVVLSNMPEPSGMVLAGVAAVGFCIVWRRTRSVARRDV